MSSFPSLYNSEQNLSHSAAEELDSTSVLGIIWWKNPKKKIAYHHEYNKMTYQKTPQRPLLQTERNLTAFEI